MRRWVNCFCLAALFAADPANAAWYKAASKHFIIYADDNSKNLLDFATKLERFDGAARVAMKMGDPPVGADNRLTVFVLPTPADVRAAVGDKTSFSAGYYTGRVEGSLAYVPSETLRSSDNWLDDSYRSDAIFFHEYTHHLMMQDLRWPYPEWYVEGFAEFFSNPKFDRDGSVWFGLRPAARRWGLSNGPEMPVETLLAGITPAMSDNQRDIFYGRGWLLSHYLLMDRKRAGQLDKFILGLAGGLTEIDAAHQAFGDLSRLDRELDIYSHTQLTMFKVPASAFGVGQIAVTRLSEGAARMMPVLARVKYGFEGEVAEALANEARAIEKSYPGDELVEIALAEAELGAKHAGAAQAAAERALAINPRNAAALVLKGRALEEQADQAQGDKRIGLFSQARLVFVAANKLDRADPDPLFEFYRTFVRTGERPSENALAALHKASDLAPQDLGLRMNSAIAYLNEGKFKEARATLTVVAYSPHAASVGDLAKRMIADIDAGRGKAALDQLRDGATPQPAPR